MLVLNLVAIIKHMVALKVIHGFRGVLDFYYHMGLPCVRSWPRKPMMGRNPNVTAQWPAWRQANILWRELPPHIKQAYADMAQGTSYTDRDMFFRGYVSGTLRYYEPVDALEES